MATRKEQLVALTTFEAEVEGETVLVHAGDVLPRPARSSKGREALFVKRSEYAQTKGTPPVEQATAAPGEKRNR